MLHTSYKYLKNNGLIATFLKVYSYLKNNGVSKLFNRFSQLNNYSKFDNPIINCSPDSLHSLPMKALVIHEENIMSEIKNKISDSIESYDVIFINFKDFDNIIQNLQFTHIVILYDFNFEFFSELMKFEIDRLSVKVITYDVLIEDFKSDIVLFKKKNILVVNCFYYPSSFGGATIVVEELNKRLYSNSIYEFITFTIGVSNNKELFGKVIRYEAFNQNVFAYYVDKLKHNSNSNNDSHLLEAFENVLINLKPELVHFHSIQGMGDEMLNVCSKHNIKNIVTCHDFWWFTEKQFLTTSDFKNDNINESIIDYLSNEQSITVLNRKKSLKNSDLILAPSLFMNEILLQLNFKNTKLNKNGVKKPINFEKSNKNKAVIFGYLGGKSEIKGYNFIVEAFKKIQSEEIKLVIVDNTTTLGFSSFSPKDFDGIPNFEIIPSFKQEQMNDFYSKIDVLLYPSLAIESFGLAPREALVRNIKVIATDLGGLSEDLNCKNSFLINPRYSLQELCDIILKVSIQYNFSEDHEYFQFNDYSEQSIELIKIYNDLLQDD